MNAVLEMAIRDAYFMRYGQRAAGNLTVEAIKAACEKVGEQGTISDVVELLALSPLGWQQRLNRK
jgi:hypothetical protein